MLTYVNFNNHLRVTKSFNKPIVQQPGHFQDHISASRIPRRTNEGILKTSQPGLGS